MVKADVYRLNLAQYVSEETSTVQDLVIIPHLAATYILMQFSNQPLKYIEILARIDYKGEAGWF